MEEGITLDQVALQRLEVIDEKTLIIPLDNTTTGGGGCKAEVDRV